MATFSDKMRTLAEARDWSIRRIALRAGIPQQTLHSALQGRELRVGAALAVAKVMDVPVEWLFTEDGWQQLDRLPHYWPPEVPPPSDVASGTREETDRIVADAQRRSSQQDTKGTRRRSRGA